MMITPADSAPVAPPQMPASSFDIQAPYAPGEPDPILAGGNADPGGRDDVAGDVAAAKAHAEARYGEHETDTYGQGSRIGDAVTFPPSPLDTPAAPGVTDPSGHYYDPPRGYEGNEPA